MKLIPISWLLLLSLRCQAFQQSSLYTYRHRSYQQTVHLEQFELRSTKSDDEHFLLTEFKTASGEIINPYKVLKVARTSTREQIRKAYIDLSRRYHPDGMRHREILPGSCNNLDDVREQWERIKLSYEILSNKKMRLKYERHEALADPGAAIKRAAVNAAFEGVKGVGKGIFDFSSFAINMATNKKNEQKNTQQANVD